ncbi:hypothetical protein [Paenibacillus sp. CF384]|uniref:hypothetical protein n=1 Tax=Paenibacillus sp. CF384 TaxID=1884382 RepID=UPI00089C7836|nr:hypothetical protein [Paenibacillus sp. CF384]SDW29326.1 hypothetical protein SAMN05518855_1001971 [Paenibacillus sp. CF384]
MKIRLLPAIITAVITAGLLVGGWYIHRNVATIEPLERIVAETPGVIEGVPVIDRSSVTIALKLDRDASLRDVYDTIATKGDDMIGKRELKLEFRNDNTTKQLDAVWSTMLFDIAQAMEHRNYADIPATLKQVQNKFAGVTAESEMDDVNVYITLKDSKSEKHIVLPRTPNTLGAWPNV